MNELPENILYYKKKMNQHSIIIKYLNFLQGGVKQIKNRKNRNSSARYVFKIPGFVENLIIPFLPKYVVHSNEELRDRVNLWFENKDECIRKHKHISEWKIKGVSDMSNLFKNRSQFNEDISGWNVSNVTNMESMFEEARTFNQDISDWNVSNVTNMEAMFWKSRKFNQSLYWNTANVRNMKTYISFKWYEFTK